MYSLTWVEITFIAIFSFIIVPAWIYLICKMVTMGLFEGIFTALNRNKGDLKDGETQINEEKGKRESTRT